MIYRDAQAELRRDHNDAPWKLAGVLIRGNWYPSRPGIDEPSILAARARNVRFVPLPPFMARSNREAVQVALNVARMEGYELPTDIRYVPWRDPDGALISLPDSSWLDTPPPRNGRFS